MGFEFKIGTKRSTEIVEATSDMMQSRQFKMHSLQFKVFTVILPPPHKLHDTIGVYGVHSSTWIHVNQLRIIGMCSIN